MASGQAASKTPKAYRNLYPGLNPDTKRSGTAAKGEQASARPVFSAKRRHDDVDEQSHEAPKRVKVRNQQPATPRPLRTPSSTRSRPSQGSAAAKRRQIQGNTTSRPSPTAESATQPGTAGENRVAPYNGSGRSEGESDFDEGAFFRRFHPSAEIVLVSISTNTLKSKGKGIGHGSLTKSESEQPEGKLTSGTGSSEPVSRKRTDQPKIIASGLSMSPKAAKETDKSGPGFSLGNARRRAGSKSKAGEDRDATTLDSKERGQD